MSRDFISSEILGNTIGKSIQSIFDLELRLNQTREKKELKTAIDGYVTKIWNLVNSRKWNPIKNQIATSVYNILNTFPVEDAYSPDKFRENWYKDIIDNSKNKEWLKSEYEKEKYLLILQNLESVIFNLELLSSLPYCSFFLQFNFKLIEPLITKDESAFYIIDTPVRKDKTTGLPVMESTSWKGCLRAAIRQLKGFLDEEQERNDPQMIRLFGNLKNEEDDKRFRAGRLVFYPTFFHCFGLDIINPHNRETKVGERPIPMEVIPIGAKGEFTLLYFTFDRIGRKEANIEYGLEKALKDEAAEDIIEVAKGIKATFTQYGFGAKTSSGFGTAEIIKDSIVIQANDNGELNNEIDKAKEILGRKEGGNE